MRSSVLAVAVLASPVWAVQPDEVLDDPVLEQRARDLSQELRCLVCRNESIDESNADLARDLRILLRERLVAGDSDEAAIAFIVDRYGEYVLLRPTTGGANWILWAAGPLMLLLAGGVGIGYLRGRAAAPQTQESALSDAEQERLRQILDE
ncbi:cytochrome c-type biogenesis protein CcmH [Sedimentitalea sp. JM2-8]|uniref:Cytochrome c-type biogenesis protein n=1 Tax=Sedimentitalea xiamensis TaxID=3050037 RepID=A0ABT7FBM3_9RHOB|nr:cytochrome c-type biogenesis protein [Sedimentitalea xiamensis]MDK3072465.1 cytochrome c-type biogenesis protein CcmH [Sedimentitalea xiamensis]